MGTCAWQQQQHYLIVWSILAMLLMEVVYCGSPVTPICARCVQDSVQTSYSAVFFLDGTYPTTVSFLPNTCVIAHSSVDPETTTATSITFPTVPSPVVVTMVCDIGDAELIGATLADLQMQVQLNDFQYSVPDIGELLAFGSYGYGTCTEQTVEGSVTCKMACRPSDCNGVFTPLPYIQFEDLQSYVLCASLLPNNNALETCQAPLTDKDYRQCCGSCSIVYNNNPEDELNKQFPCVQFCSRGQFINTEEAPLALLKSFNTSSGLVAVDHPISCIDAGWEFAKCTCLNFGLLSVPCPTATYYDEVADEMKILSSVDQLAQYDGVGHYWCEYTFADDTYRINLLGDVLPVPIAVEVPVQENSDDLNGQSLTQFVCPEGNGDDCSDFYSAAVESMQLSCTTGCCCKYGVGGPMGEDECTSYYGTYINKTCNSVFAENPGFCESISECCVESQVTATIGTVTCQMIYQNSIAYLLELRGPCNVLTTLCPNSECTETLGSQCVTDVCPRVSIVSYVSNIDGDDGAFSDLRITDNETAPCLYELTLVGFDTPASNASALFVNTRPCEPVPCCFNETTQDATAYQCVTVLNGRAGEESCAPAAPGCTLKIGTDPEDLHTYGKQVCNNCCSNSNPGADHCVKMCHYEATTFWPQSGGQSISLEEAHFPEAVLSQSSHLIDTAAYEAYLLANFPTVPLNDSKTCASYYQYYIDGLPNNFDLSESVIAAARASRVSCDCYYDGACPDIDINCEYFRFWRPSVHQELVLTGRLLSNIDNRTSLRCRYTYPASEISARRMEDYQLIPQSAFSYLRNDCLTPTGRCCTLNGTCTDTDKWSCLDQLHGAYAGDGTSCNDGAAIEKGGALLPNANVCEDAIGACCVPARYNNLGCVDDVSEQQCLSIHPMSTYHGRGTRCKDTVCPANYCDLDPQSGTCQDDCCGDSDPDTLDHCIHMCSVYYLDTHGARKVLASGPVKVFESESMMEVPAKNCTHLRDLVAQASLLRVPVLHEEHCECHHVRACVHPRPDGLPIDVSPYTLMSDPQPVSEHIEEYPECFCPPVVTNCGLFEAALHRDYGIYGVIITNTSIPPEELGNYVEIVGQTRPVVQTDSQDLWCAYIVSHQGQVAGDFANIMDQDVTDAAVLLADISSASVAEHCGLPDSEFSGSCCEPYYTTDGFYGVNCVVRTKDSCTEWPFTQNALCATDFFPTGGDEFVCLDVDNLLEANYCSDATVAVCEHATGECQVKTVADANAAILAQTHDLSPYVTSECPANGGFCPIPKGACCIASSSRGRTCADLTMAQCNALALAVFQGNSTQCATTSACNDDCEQSIWIRPNTGHTSFSPVTVHGYITQGEESITVPNQQCGYQTGMSGVWYVIEGTGGELQADACDEGTQIPVSISVYTHAPVAKDGTLEESCDTLQCVKSVTYQCTSDAADSETMHFIDFPLKPEPNNWGCLGESDDAQVYGQLSVKRTPESPDDEPQYYVCLSIEPNPECMEIVFDVCGTAAIEYGQGSLLTFDNGGGFTGNKFHYETCVTVSSVTALQLIDDIEQQLITQVQISDADCSAVDDHTFVSIEQPDENIFATTQIVIGDYHNETIAPDTALKWCSSYGASYYIFVHNWEFPTDEGAFTMTITSNGPCLSNDRCKNAIVIPPIYPHPYSIEQACSPAAVGYDHQYDHIDSGDDWATDSEPAEFEPELLEGFPGFSEGGNPFRKAHSARRELSVSETEFSGPSISASISETQDTDELLESLDQEAQRDHANGEEKIHRHVQNKYHVHSDYIEYEHLERIHTSMYTAVQTAYDEHDRNPRRVCISSGKSHHDANSIYSTLGSSGNDLYGTQLASLPIGNASRCGYKNGCGVWFRFKHPRKYVLEASTCYPYTTFPASISVFTGTSCEHDTFSCVSDTVIETCGDGGGPLGSATQGSIARWCAEPNVDYHILIHGVDGEIGDFELCIEEIKPCECSEDQDCQIRTIGTPVDEVFAQQDVESTCVNHENAHAATCMMNVCDTENSKCIEQIDPTCCYDTLPFICNNAADALAAEWIDRNEEQYARFTRAITGYVDIFSCRVIPPFCHASEFFEQQPHPSSRPYDFAEARVRPTTARILQDSGLHASKRVAENTEQTAADDLYRIRIPRDEDFPPWGPPCCEYNQCFNDTELLVGLTRREWLLKAHSLMTDSKILLGRYRVLDRRECLFSSYHQQAQQSACCANLILRSLTEACILSNQTGVLDHQQCVNDPTLFHLGLCQSKIDYAVLSDDVPAIQGFTCSLNEAPSFETSHHTRRDNDYNDFVANTQRVRISVRDTYPFISPQHSSSAPYVISAYNVHVDPRARDSGSAADMAYVFAIHTRSHDKAPPYCTTTDAFSTLPLGPIDEHQVLSYFMGVFTQVPHLALPPGTSTTRFGIKPEAVNANDNFVDANTLDSNYIDDIVVRQQIVLLESTRRMFSDDYTNTRAGRDCLHSDARVSLTVNIAGDNGQSPVFQQGAFAFRFEDTQFRITTYDRSCGVYGDVAIGEQGWPLSYHVPNACEVYGWNLENIPLCVAASQAVCVGGQNSTQNCTATQHCVNGICYSVGLGSAGLCAYVSNGTLIPEVDEACLLANNQCPGGQCYGLQANERGSRPDTCTDFDSGVLQKHAHATTFSCKLLDVTDP